MKRDNIDQHNLASPSRNIKVILAVLSMDKHLLEDCKGGGNEEKERLAFAVFKVICVLILGFQFIPSEPYFSTLLNEVIKHSSFAWILLKKKANERLIRF